MTNNTTTINPYIAYKARLDLMLRKAIKITIADDKYAKLEDFANQWKIAKEEKGLHYATDQNYLAIRSLTGHAGQLALEQHLNVKFTDLDPTFSYDKNIPDLSPIGLKVGIKTHRFQNPPLLNCIPEKMYKNMDEQTRNKFYYPQIIMSKDPDCEKTFYLLGVYSVNILWHPDYTEKQMIYDESLSNRGTKIPFIGMHRGHVFNNLEELKNIVGPKWTI